MHSIYGIGAEKRKYGVIVRVGVGLEMIYQRQNKVSGYWVDFLKKVLPVEIYQRELTWN